MKRLSPILISFTFSHSTGYFDIKQSLSIKRRQDRSEALQLPDETDPSTLLALGQREFKSGNTDIAILFISKARSTFNLFNFYFGPVVLLIHFHYLISGT